MEPIKKNSLSSSSDNENFQKIKLSDNSIRNDLKDLNLVVKQTRGNSIIRHQFSDELRHSNE
jgi:hypothetical protein